MTTTPQPTDGAIALLPCPFCGEQPTLIPDSQTDRLSDSIFCMTENCVAPYTVAGTREEVIAAWNTRPAQLGGGVDAWLPIESAPSETDVWLFDAEQEPQQFVGRLTEGYDGPYWQPVEQLVADVMDIYMHPTHWQPLPPPPSALGKGGA